MGDAREVQERGDSSVQSFSRVWLFVTPWIAAHQASLSPTPRACSNSCPSSQWCHLTISSSAAPFSSCPQSFPASILFNESAFCTRWPKYWSFSFSISSAQSISFVQLFVTSWTAAARPPCSSATPGACSDSCPSSWWCHSTIQPSPPLSSPSPPAFNFSQQQGLLQWVGSSHQVAKVLELQLQHQSFQWTFRTDIF